MEPYVRRAVLWAPRSALAAIFAGIAILIGYAVGWEPLWRPLSGGPATHPLTAVAIILLGFSALLANPSRPSNASAALAVLAGTLAAARLLTIAIGRNDIFQVWSPFSDTLATAASAGHPISMGLRASIMIVLLAVSLCLIRARLVMLSQFVAIAAAYPPVFAVVGYLYGVDDFRGLFSATTLGMGVLCIAAVLGRRRPVKPRDFRSFGSITVHKRPFTFVPIRVFC